MAVDEEYERRIREQLARLFGAAGFGARGIQVWQFVFSGDGVKAGYAPEHVR
jgi:hypothetical protein